MSITTKRTPSHNRVDHAQPTRRSVYSGTGIDRLGDVEQRGAEHVARNRQGRIIGSFSSLVEAVAAIEQAAEHAA